MGDALPKWLAVTASRESLRILRIANRTPDLEAIGIDLDELVAREEMLAEDAAIFADRSFRLREGLSKIDERCQLLLQMLYFRDGTSYAEIGSALGMPIGAIGPTRARCLEKLRVTLSKENFFEI